MYALILTGINTRTIPVALAQFLIPHGMFWVEMCAAGIVAIAPILVFSLFLQRYLVRGRQPGQLRGNLKEEENWEKVKF